MATTSVGTWNQARQAFADQFQLDGSNYVYRKSQKGEAIRVSAEERSRFIDEFSRNLRRATWTIYLGLTVTFGGVIAYAIDTGSDASEGPIFGAVAVAMVPYFLYYRWAWAAPARQLAGRTPIAGERSTEEVRRIRLGRLTYGGLATAAFTGLLLPFIGSSHADVFSGWNRLWLVFGAGLVLLAAVQAFRKWRFEQGDSHCDPVTPSAERAFEQTADDAITNAKSRIWRYAPLAVLVAGGAFIALTPVGKQIVRMPLFLPILMVGCGAWALLTVARGFRSGEIEPFARGFYNTYERETQPKRYWASMAWNTIFGCFCVAIAFASGWQAIAEDLRDRCDNDGGKFSPQVALSACSRILDTRQFGQDFTNADALVGRGIAYGNLHQPERAIADFTAAIRLQPDDFAAYYDRAFADQQVGDLAGALSDYGRAIQLRPQDWDSYMRRGMIYLNLHRYSEAADDFTRAHEIDPKSPWPLANRGLAYAWERDSARAEADLAAARAIDPRNYVVSHGEAVLSMQAGDPQAAIDHLTQALEQNPTDRWALGARATAYRRIGEEENAQADLVRLKTLLRQS